ncbi:unnamed protein product, partial [Closterium sp. NIES-53]
TRRTWAGRHLATFTRRPGTSLYTLAIEPPQTLLRHHRLGHPSLPRLRGMHSRLLVSGLPRYLPPLLPSPASPCLPCIEGRQCSTPHSSSFPPTIAPLQTLHMDMWGPAHVIGQGRERYFLLVVDDYKRYTTVFPLRSKGEVPDVLIPWIRAVRLQLRNRFCQDLPVLRLHPDRRGEFSSDLLREFCRGEGILQSFTLPASPQQNWIAERRIGLVMELNLWPRVSLPETSPTLRWTGKVGDASVFRVWGSRAFVCDTSAGKLSAHAIPCVFLGFPPDAPGWQFYHPTSCRVLPSEDVTFDESVPFYRLFPYRSAPLPPLPLFLALGPPPLDPLLPQGLAPSSVSQVDPLPDIVRVEVTVDSGAARGAASGGAVSRGAEPARAEPGGAEPEGAELGGAEFEGSACGGAEHGGSLSLGGPPVAGDIGAAGPRGARSGGTGAAGAGGVAGVGAGGTGAGAAGVSGAAGPVGARTGGTGSAGAGGAAGVGAGGTGAGAARVTGVAGPGGARTEGTRAAGARGAAGVLGLPSSTGLTPPLRCPPSDQSQPPLQPASPLPAPSPYAEQTRGLTECCELVSRPASQFCAVRTRRHVPRPRPPPVPGMHNMALRPSSVPQRVPLPSPLASSLADGPDPESGLAHAASPTIPRLLAIVVTDPSFESATASALVTELVDFAAVYRLDYATALVAESRSACPPSVRGECALGTDVLEDRQEEFECLAAAVPSLVAMLLAPEGDPDAPAIPNLHSYAEAITVPPSKANIVDGMWIFRVKRPPGSPPAFKARYFAQGFSQRQGVDFFHTFSPTLKMTTLRVLLHVAAQRDYKFHSLDFSTAFLQGSLHEEIWLRRPPGFTGSFPPGTKWSLRRPVYGLRQAPREWHDTLRTTLAAFGFAPLTLDPSLFLRTDTSLPPFYILVYVDDLVFATADTEALALVKSELQKRHTCTDMGPLALRLPVLLATVHSSAYQSFALSSTFRRVHRAEWPVSRACGLPHVPDDLHST